MRLALSLLLIPSLLSAAPKPLFRSPVIDTKTPNHSVDIDVSLDGAKELFLVVTDAGNGFTADWADWAEPRLVLADGSEKKLTEIEWKSAQSGWGGVRVNANAEGKELRSAGKSIEYGLGTHANSVIAFNLPAGTKRFKARGALDEGGTKQGNSSSVTFAIYTENPGPIAASDINTAAHEPEAATQQLDVHPECVVQLFASEPMMLSPASIDIDHRGRVWVCEVVNYRKHNGERAEGDRILILEDTDGDAKADKSTVFHQGADVNSAHGICVLGNKALISCGDDVFWLIDDNGDDKADRKELMFTKIGGAQHDHGIHAFHFGPDGRLYFNFGNAGKQLCDKDGNLITDIHGVKCTNQNNRPYQQGMVFRCELDGSKVEVLAWNFRNNWEVAVDSFGTMWQSDNDDDGNKGVRINYVMEFGNYGYSDEMTGEGWQVPRIGIESEIPQRHWHQNDPGVVPNMLLTGAGSPTGMQVYEGDLLPSIFHGQPIHCDAGPNVVRGYITQPDGAGYKAEIVNLLDGSQNRWFRPSDVAVAPDGSLIVADWYDPGVGGHGMGDVTRGRLFRVTTKAAEKYVMPSPELAPSDQAFEWLKSPNEDRRYWAMQAIKRFDQISKDSVGGLLRIFENKQAQPQHRARALWFWSRLQPEEAITAAITDTDANIRITALRAARQLWQQKQPEKLREVIAKVVNDKSPAVRREAALALRFDETHEASALVWTLPTTAAEWDRWMTEACGIASDLNWNSRMKVMMYELDKVPVGTACDQADCELLIRARDEHSASSLADMLFREETRFKPLQKQPLKVLRALQLLSYHHREEVSAAALTIFLKADAETALAATALIDRNAIASNPEAKTRLDALLKPVIGKADFVALVERLNLTGFEKELLDFISANPNAPESVNAARLIGFNSVRVFLHDLLWAQDRVNFQRRLAQFVSIAAGRGIKPLFVLFDSCWDPVPRLGVQRAPKPGVHNSAWVQSPGAERLDDPSYLRVMHDYVTGVMTQFRNDSRVLGWDLWNEPDNPADTYRQVERKDKSDIVAELLPQVFQWGRTINPVQPLTSGVWQGNWSNPQRRSEIATIQLDNSDVITFHNYGKPSEFESRIGELAPIGRPIVCTEYLARPLGSTIEGILPIAKRRNVGAFNWGLVAGKTQTYLPWDSWDHPYATSPTPWFHDLLQPDGRPYRVDEIQTIRNLVGVAGAA